MGLVVNTNTQSLFAQRALRANTLGLKRNIERLSTGFRINRAADDAAGLSISNKLTTQIKGLDKAAQNAADGISLIQTAEGGLSIIQENLQRIRELVVQGSNGTNGTKELDAIQREINERVRIIGDIAEATTFNGISLLYDNAASDDDIVLQTGSTSDEQTIITLRSEQATSTGIDIDIDYVTQDTTSDYGHLVEGVESGFALNRLHLTGSIENSLAGSSYNVSANVDNVDILIENISRMRSYLCTIQNSLESKIDYLDIAKENAEASRSRIQDVDIAQESSILVKNQILQQTASAMLSQANAQPQIALSLLPQ